MILFDHFFRAAYRCPCSWSLPPSFSSSLALECACCAQYRMTLQVVSKVIRWTGLNVKIEAHNVLYVGGSTRDGSMLLRAGRMDSESIELRRPLMERRSVSRRPTSAAYWMRPRCFSTSTSMDSTSVSPVFTTFSMVGWQETCGEEGWW
jgi:hypothetical protein